jgi:hypothetical protein
VGANNEIKSALHRLLCGATIKQMANDTRSKNQDRNYAEIFWPRYWKDLIGWALKTFWLRIGILLAVPIVLAIQQYHLARTDWHTIRVTLLIYGAVLALYMIVHLYLTAKKLDGKICDDLIWVLKEKEELRVEVERLSWPENRPILVFDSWGEVPHDDPRARFLEVSEYRNQREYFERGIFIVNRGGDAHEIEVIPIQLTKGVRTSSSYIARIDADSKGFAFISMDAKNNVKFGEDLGIWDLPKVMRTIEDKLNAVNIAQGRLAVEVGARYRDANGAWYLSWCTMEYGKEQNRIIFNHTEHRKFGSEKPEIPEVSD